MLCWGVMELGCRAEVERGVEIGSGFVSCRLGSEFWETGSGCIEFFCFLRG